MMDFEIAYGIGSTGISSTFHSTRVSSMLVPEFGSFLGRTAKGIRSKKDEADTEIG